MGMFWLSDKNVPILCNGFATFPVWICLSTWWPMMIGQEPIRLSFYLSFFCVGLSCKSCLLSTPTCTKFHRGRSGLLAFGFPSQDPAMPLDKTNWLTLDVPKYANSLFSQVCLLPAAAFAKLDRRRRCLPSLILPSQDPAMPLDKTAWLSLYAPLCANSPFDQCGLLPAATFAVSRYDRRNSLSVHDIPLCRVIGRRRSCALLQHGRRGPALDVPDQDVERGA